MVAGDLLGVVTWRLGNQVRWWGRAPSLLEFSGVCAVGSSGRRTAQVAKRTVIESTPAVKPECVLSGTGWQSLDPLVPVPTRNQVVW